MKPILVSPSLDAEYQAFYLRGVAELFPERRLQLAAKPFAGLRWGFLGLLDLETDRRVCVDTKDTERLDPQWLAWSDVYGKVNHDLRDYDLDARGRVVPIGPGFAARVFSRAASLAWAARAISIDRSSRRSATRTLSRWRRQYRSHAPLSAYEHRPSLGAVYFSSSLWREEPECNAQRLAFIRACKSIPGLRFEGGFAPFLHGFELPTDAVAEHVVPRRVHGMEWVRRTQGSALAFIAPGVHGCLTWRLGQSLALGKAILATPLRRRLPAPLEHRRNVHFVEPSEPELRAAVFEIVDDDKYRERLERGAAEYYAEHLAPKRVMAKLLSSAGAR